MSQQGRNTFFTSNSSSISCHMAHQTTSTLSCNASSGSMQTSACVGFTPSCMKLCATSCAHCQLTFTCHFASPCGSLHLPLSAS